MTVEIDDELVEQIAGLIHAGTCKGEETCAHPARTVDVVVAERIVSSLAREGRLVPRQAPVGDASVQATGQHAAALTFIREHVTEHGYPPTVRELGDAIGVKSPSTVTLILDRMMSAGLIRRVPGRPRAIQIVESRAEQVIPPGYVSPVRPAECDLGWNHIIHHGEEGDHVVVDGLHGTALVCAECGRAFMLDPDEMQPGPPPGGSEDYAESGLDEFHPATTHNPGGVQ